MREMSNTMQLVMAAFCAVSLSSCEYEFDIMDKDAEPELFVECFAGSNDSTVIKAGVALPLNMPFEDIDINALELDMKVNGKSIGLELKYKEYGGLPYPYWFSGQQYSPGDKVEIKAEYPGIGSVSTDARIPLRLPSGSVFMDKEDEELETYINISGIPEECRYLGLKVIQELSFINEEGELLSSSREMLVESSESFYNKVSLEQISKNFIFWDCNDTGNNNIRLKLYNNVYIKLEYVSVRYKVIFYNLSEELYRYYKAVAVSANGAWNMDGWTLYRSMYSYSNIDGGFGILGGMTVAQTDWFASETETEF